MDNNINGLKKILYKNLYKKSLYEFVKAFWNTCEPSKFIDGKIIQFYCEIFHYFCRDWVGGYEEKNIELPVKTDDIDIIDVRQGKRNLCLNVPPRHTKSDIFNVMGPTWVWLNYPIKTASISHTAGLATQMNTKRYSIINSEKFKFFYGDELKLIKNTSSSLIDTRGGELYSLNRNAFTGYGGDIIVNDDLTNAETARKDKEEMNNAWSYYTNTMPSRINDPNRCFIMNVQQRLAPNDVTGRILDNPKLASTYCFVVLPARFERTTYLVCPISGRIIKYEKGEYLWPERFGDYETLRYQVGESVFETQYLQKPIASDKTIIKQEMIIEKDLPDTPGIENADMVYSSHDFPVKDKDTSDYLGSILSYKVGANLYITDCLEKRMAFTKSVNYVKQLDTLYPGIIQIIEDKANGSPILEQLKDEVAGMQAFQPGTNSKVQRLESASLYFESHNVIFVKTVFDKITNTWKFSEQMQNLIKRLLDFPFVEHDDIVDALTQNILFVFMDRRYMVYGRAFSDNNIINKLNIPNNLYSNVFFNKEGDIWKASKIGIEYGSQSKLIVLDEIRFKASIDDGLKKLKEFSPKSKMFIDCSAADGLRGMYNKSIVIERYEIEDFDRSVSQVNLALSKNLILLTNECVLTKGDIENFKFSKSKDDNVKYITEKDGFVACIRCALHYYGGIVY